MLHTKSTTRKENRMSTEGNVVRQFPGNTRIARVAVGFDTESEFIDIELITAYSGDWGSTITAGVTTEGEAIQVWKGLTNKSRFTAHIDTSRELDAFNPQGWLEMYPSRVWPANNERGIWAVGEEALWNELARQLSACPLAASQPNLIDRIYYEYNVAVALRFMAEQSERKIDWADEAVPLIMARRSQIAQTSTQQDVVERIQNWFATTAELAVQVDLAHQRGWISGDAYRHVITRRNRDVASTLYQIASPTHVLRFALSSSPTGQDFNPARQTSTLEELLKALDMVHHIELTS